MIIRLQHDKHNKRKRSYRAVVRVKYKPCVCVCVCVYESPYEILIIINYVRMYFIARIKILIIHKYTNYTFRVNRTRNRNPRVLLYLVMYDCVRGRNCRLFIYLFSGVPSLHITSTRETCTDDIAGTLISVMFYLFHLIYFNKCVLISAQLSPLFGICRHCCR